MRLVLFEGLGAGGGTLSGVLTDAGVVDVSSATVELMAHSPQQLMEQIIDGFDTLWPTFERLTASALPLPLDVVRLRPPLPRPGKILCCIGNYWEHAQWERSVYLGDGSTNSQAVRRAQQ
jgi:2-keto-4-pentenoate hydratase/2-oxohepta-3-ene-1,7-dioic acid hydratase in catechol pathway